MQELGTEGSRKRMEKWLSASETPPWLSVRIPVVAGELQATRWAVKLMATTTTMLDDVDDVDAFVEHVDC
jgi:hypothetical protein